MNELYEAVRAKDSARVQALVDADPSLAIFAAAMQGDHARVEQLLAANRSLISAVSPDGWTPLHLAAFFGGADAARALLNKGASPSARSTNAMQNLPLHAAAAGRHADLVKLLIEHGSPVDARQHGGWTALHAAALKGYDKVVQFLADHGANLSARDVLGRTALDWAQENENSEMADLIRAWLKK